MIELVESAAGEDPGARLRALFGAVLDAAGADTTARVELALQASADDPLVGSALRRMTERRLGYLAALFGRLGFTAAQARRRAVLAHSIYLGQAQLVRSTPERLAQSPAARRAQLDDALRAMTAPPS